MAYNTHAHIYTTYIQRNTILSKSRLNRKSLTKARETGHGICHTYKYIHTATCRAILDAFEEYITNEDKRERAWHLYDVAIAAEVVDKREFSLISKYA
jgi:hypothetical protein